MYANEKDKEEHMALYMIQVAYSQDGWAALIKNPQDRLKQLQPVVKKLGGKVLQGWFCFGEYDLISILEMPDNVSIGAFSVAAAAGGAVKSLTTTPLMSIDDGMKMLSKAAKSGYAPPS